MSGARQVRRERATKECRVSVTVSLDGEGRSVVDTGLGFLDHMLATLALHARLDLEIEARGDLEVDDHHTVEDCALLLGAALDEALGERAGIRRFGSAYAPLDEALARAVLDLSGRPFASVELGLERERLGAVATENLTHFLASLATTLRAALHVDVLRGVNDHHRAEAAFKAVAIALRQAIALERTETVPSTKGVL